MPCAPLLHFADVDRRSEAGEVMSGVLEVTRGSPLTTQADHRSPGCSGATTSQRVFVRVYRTSSEHFAVLYPVRAIVTACRPLASLNLRSCSVKVLPAGCGVSREFRVSPRSCEGVSVTFAAMEGSSEGQMSQWLSALTEVKQSSALRRKKVSDHRLPLPVLMESDEDSTE